MTDLSRRLPRACALALAAAVLCSQGTASAQAATETAAPSAASSLPRELGKPEDDVVIDVARYEVDGLSGITSEMRAALAAATAPYTGPGRHYEDLMNAVAAVTQTMQSRFGYYVGFAYLPEQKLQGGVVRIQALEGRLGAVRLNWSDGLPVRRSVVENHLAKLKPGQVLRAGELERIVYLVNDLQGISTRFEIEPGTEPGTANLVVTPEAEPRAGATASLDSLGSRYTGTGRGSVQATLDSPLGLGDAASASYLGSQTGGLELASLSYVVPLGTSGLKVGVSMAEVRYELNHDLFAGTPEGVAVSNSAFAVYPVVRSRNYNLFATLSYERKHFADTIYSFTVRKNSQDWLLNLVGDFRDTLGGGSINTYELGLVQGRMAYEPFLYPPGNISTEFSKISLGASRLQNLVTNRLMFYGRYRAQIAQDNLDPSERYALGGAGAVRAYAPGEAPADTAHLLTAELRLLPPESWFGRTARELMFSAFYDWGHATYAHDDDHLAPGTRNSATLSGYGLGATWERPGAFSIRLDLAWRALGEAEAQPDANRRAPRANLVLTHGF